MKSTDKFLVGIVVGIVLVILVALVITLTRPEPAYQAEDSPEGVVHNYLLALQKGAYQRAYEYLSPNLQGYPHSAAEFIRDVESRSWSFPLDQNPTLSIASTKINGSKATVSVNESRFRGGTLFDSSQNVNTFRCIYRRSMTPGRS